MFHLHRSGELALGRIFRKRTWPFLGGRWWWPRCPIKPERERGFPPGSRNNTCPRRMNNKPGSCLIQRLQDRFICSLSFTLWSDNTCHFKADATRQGQNVRRDSDGGNDFDFVEGLHSCKKWRLSYHLPFHHSTNGVEVTTLKIHLVTDWREDLEAVNHGFDGEVEKEAE